MGREKRLNELKILDWFKKKFKGKKGKVSNSSVKQGFFYAFEYDSKLFENDILPYYDSTPLVLCLGENENYMLGLNFHYLPEDRRKKTINKLKKRYKKQWVKEKKLPNVSWNTVKSELKYATFMVKLYIKTRMKKTNNFKNSEMEEAIKIPSANFIGTSAKKVWRSLGL